MAEIRLGMVESHFADIVWQHAPLRTKELIKLCEQELNWKRTTTYTVLKKMCERGIFNMKDQLVTVLLTKDQFHAIQSEAFVQTHFQGSLPAFVAAFTTRQTLTPEEQAEIKKLIDAYGKA